MIKKIEYPNLDIYEGEVVDNKPHGIGTMYSKREFVKETNFTSEGNSMYEGEWQNGLMHGKGTLIIKEISDEHYKLDPMGESYEGTKYVGDFINGKYDGFGVLSFVNPDGLFYQQKVGGLKLKQVRNYVNLRFILVILKKVYLKVNERKLEKISC